MAWSEDVAIDLDANVVLGFSAVGDKKVYCTLATPAEGEHAGVYQQSHGAPHFINQLAEFTLWVLIKTHFFAKVFRVETPALDKRGDTTEAAPPRMELALLLCQRHL